MPWVRPLYTPQQVNAAANNLMRMMYYPDNSVPDEVWDEYDDALARVNNWRAAHGHPLNTFQTNLRVAARRLDAGSVVAQRTKRLTSITEKLYRLPRMKLTQMQDIGGCRAVLRSVSDVRKLVHYYEEESAIKHVLVTRDDYIASPPPSGYRGIHLVYRYLSDKDTTKVYNGLKIEMQIRSQYQHAWATAVETVGTFVGEALKSSMGSEKWLRFFALMGTAIAIRERTSTVPGTPGNRLVLVSELLALSTELEVARRLRAYNAAVRTFEKGADPADKYYLLNLDIQTEQLTVTGFKFGEIDEASKQYLAAEKAAKGSVRRDAVLVSVDSLAALPRAYPNYFADTRVFLDLVDQTLTGRPRRIITTPLQLRAGASEDEGAE